MELASYLSKIYIIALFTRLTLLYWMFIKNKHSNVCLKFLCDAKLITPLFIFLIFLVKSWSENSISIPIGQGNIYFWIWLFGGAAYLGQGQEEVRGRGGDTDEQTLSDKQPLIRCGETYNICQELFKFKFFRGTEKRFYITKMKENVLHFVVFLIKCRGFTKIIGGRVTFLRRS